MHKKLIKKYQYGERISMINPKFDIRSIQENFAKSLSYPKLKTPERPIAPPSPVLVDNISGKWSFDNLKSSIKGVANSIGTGALNNAPELAEGAIKALGGQDADVKSGLEQGFSTVSSTIFKGAVATGNPFLIGGAGLLKGFDLMNNFLGKKSKKQGTIGLDTGPYAFQTSLNAGKKFTLFGRSKRRAANRRTQSADRTNLKGAAVSQDAQEEELAANNSYQDIYSKNNQSLMGGVNFSMLSAKKGGTINPASLRNIVKKAKKGMKITRVEEIQQNVIPEGALHSRLNHLDGEIGEQVTTKGIPVITLDEGGKVTQHAEIEKSEIIFTLKTTQKVEDLFKKYNETDSEKEKDLIAIECGKFLTEEIINNTDDRVGLLNDENNETNTKK